MNKLESIEYIKDKDLKLKNKEGMKEVYTEHVKKLLLDRGVTVESMAKIVYKLQKKYMEDVTIEQCCEVLESILTKREVQNTIMTGIAIDVAAEKGLIEDRYLLDMLKRDEGLYGLDEILPLGIVNLYGTIAFTNFGFLDKEKLGIIKELDNKKGKINVFLDDIVAGLCGAACSKMSHSFN